MVSGFSVFLVGFMIGSTEGIEVTVRFLVGFIVRFMVGFMVAFMVGFLEESLVGLMLESKGLGPPRSRRRRG